MMSSKKAQNAALSASAAKAAVVGVWQREVGAISNRSFAHRMAASEELVLRLEILRKLKKHTGCVNTVRLAQIPERGNIETLLLGSHQGRAHKLAIEHGSPYIFYTCGEDGLVQHFDIRTKFATRLFACHSIHDSRGYMPYVYLNAITIDPRNPNIFAVAGGDEYTRLYDIRKYKWDGTSDIDQPVDLFCPVHLINVETVGITGLAFSEQSELLVSYNDENIYLFSKDMGIGPSHPPSSPLSREAYESRSDDSPQTSSSAMDADDKPGPQVFKGHRNRKTVKGVNFFGPKSEYVMSGSDCGRIFIWKKEGGELIRIMEGDRNVVNCIEPHPHTTMLVSSGIESDVKIWTPKAKERARLPSTIEEWKPKRRGWMFRVPSPQEMLLQFLPMQSPGLSPEDDRESHISGMDFLEMIFAFNRQRDDSSDDGDTSNPEDFFS